MTHAKAALIALLLAAPLPAAAGPVLLELFTSQACSSCPPADALLAQLAPQPGLLALDFHVDYWDGPGWRDPYSAHAFTERQQNYANLLPGDGVYTPELVVGGLRGVVGSDARAVDAAIANARSAPQIPVSLRRDGESLVVEIGAGAGGGVWFVAGYDSRHETRVRGGENGGRTLVEANVVRSLRQAGRWSGSPLRQTVAAPDGERAAVFVQAEDGRILGAATLQP